MNARTALLHLALASGLMSPLASQTSIELGGGIVRMQGEGEWRSPLGAYGEAGIRFSASRQLEARLGALALRRSADDETGIRVRAAGLIGELATPIRGTGIYVGGGLGILVIDQYQRGFDDAVQVVGGGFVAMLSISARQAIGRASIDARIRLIRGDLGDPNTITLGLVVAPRGRAARL